MKCTLLPSGKTLELNSSESLLIQLKNNGFKIKSSCGGCASCGDCVLKVQSGEDHLSSSTFEELRLLGNVFHITKERLACQTKITGDVVLDISQHENAKKEESIPSKKGTKLVKRAEVREKRLNEMYDKAQINQQPRPPKQGGHKKPKPFHYSNTKQENEE